VVVGLVGGGVWMRVHLLRVNPFTLPTKNDYTGASIGTENSFWGRREVVIREEVPDKNAIQGHVQLPKPQQFDHPKVSNGARRGGHYRCHQRKINLYYWCQIWLFARGSTQELNQSPSG